MTRGQPHPAVVETPADRAAATADQQRQEEAHANLQQKLGEKAATEAPTPDAPQQPPEPAEPPQAAAPAENPAPTPAPSQEQSYEELVEIDGKGNIVPKAAPTPAPVPRPAQPMAPRTITAAGVPVEDPPPPQLSEKVRRFACPSHPGGKFLAVAGREVRVVDPLSPTGLKSYQRDGDKWVKFSGGISGDLYDLDVIEWLESQPDKFKDVMDPDTKLWFDLVTVQQPTSRSEALVKSGIDINAVLRGEAKDSGLLGNSPVDNAQRQVEEINRGE